MRGIMKYAIQLIVASAITVTLSYLLVRILLEQSEPEEPSAAAIHEAQQLRDFSNELVVLTADFLGRAEQPESQPLGQGAEFNRWASRVYGPKINDLRQRMLRSDLAGRAYHALLAAADRTAAMGARPDDDRLRRLAARDVLAAAGQVETRIAALGLAERINPPQVKPGFRVPR